jgi:hypothetical protein
MTANEHTTVTAGTRFGTLIALRRAGRGAVLCACRCTSPLAPGNFPEALVRPVYGARRLGVRAKGRTIVVDVDALLSGVIVSCPVCEEAAAITAESEGR